MANFRVPTAANISSPASMQPVQRAVEADTSGINRGMQQFASGLDEAADQIDRVGNVLLQRQNTADIAKATAIWTKGALDIGNAYADSTDYEKIEGNADKESMTLRDQAGAIIRDENARNEFLADLDIKRAYLVDGARDRARQLRESNDRTALENAITINSEIISDPTASEEVRTQARKQIEGSLEVARQTGLLLPAEVAKLRRTGLEAAERSLAFNRASVRMLTDPQDVMSGMAIPVGGTATPSIAAAAATQSGGKMQITPQLARMAAPGIGDTALPQDDKLISAYLSDPETNARYSQAVIETLTNRFNGDLTAAVIASAPNGSLELAEKWVKSGHDEGVLPEKVRTYYTKVMSSTSSESATQRIPVVGTRNVDIAKLDAGVLDRYESLQSTFGTAMPIVGSDPLGTGITVDVKNLAKDERVRLIEMASAMGFVGIGLTDKDTLVLNNDAESARVVGKPPAWAKEVMARHEAGSIEEIMPPERAVAPEYAALDFDTRLKLYNQARASLDQQQVSAKAGIAIAVENAPIAIAQTGGYTGVMPVAEDFVHAYGAAEGIERWKAFDAAVDTAEASFSMRTMSSDEIATMVENARPTQGGDMAAVEQKSFDVISDAAAATLKAREDDPAGYVIQTFPEVAKAWETAGENPEALAQAMTATATAQESLGMEMKLLPKAQAEAVAAAFNNVEIPQEQRIGTLTQLLFTAKDPVQREAMFDQLTEAGVPRIVRGAVAAFERGETGAANRLFRAALLDPAKLPGKLPESDTAINEAIQGAIFDQNQIGDVVYGLTGGTAENLQGAIDDGTLFTNAVKLRLFDGTATSVDQAIELTRRDMYGDVKVVTGKGWGGAAGVKIAIGVDEDEDAYRSGFNSLLGEVGDAMMANLTPMIAGASTANSEAAILATARDQRVAQVLAEGYFTSAGGDSYAFVDPYTGQAIPDPQGDGPLLFSREDVLDAGMTAAAVQDEITGMTAPSIGFGMGTLDPTLTSGD